MHPWFSLPYMLPTLCLFQMMSLCGPRFGLPRPGARDTFASDLE